MSPVVLPSLDEIRQSSSDDPLKSVVSTLFERSPVLDEHLIPTLAAASTTFTSYTDLIDRSASIIRSWPPHLRSAFISGHPRIGEQNPEHLSALSAEEQARRFAEPWVIERLAWLNELYEGRYEGLRYVTFVNGRTRREVMEEMEGALGVPEKAKGPECQTRRLEEEVERKAVDVGGEVWSKELERAVGDVILIAKDRVRKLGLV